MCSFWVMSIVWRIVNSFLQRLSIASYVDVFIRKLSEKFWVEMLKESNENHKNYWALKKVLERFVLWKKFYLTFSSKLFHLSVLLTFYAWAKTQPANWLTFALFPCNLKVLNSLFLLFWKKSKGACCSAVKTSCFSEAAVNGGIKLPK